MVNWSSAKVPKQSNRQWRVFSINSAGTIEHSCTKRKKKELWSIAHTILKIYLKWTIDLYIKPKTMKLLGENIGENLCNFKDFLIGSKKHRPLKNWSIRFHQN